MERFPPQELKGMAGQDALENRWLEQNRRWGHRRYRCL
jgi:hypothetical protein